MKTIALNEETWRRLKELKEKLEMKSFDDVINKLIENWNLSVIREITEKVNVSADIDDVASFFTQLRSGKWEGYGRAP